MNTNDYALPHLIGELPDYLRELTMAVSTSLDVDFGMALTTLLSGMASGVHGLNVVRRPDGGLEPLALFFMVLSGAATGKTRTHKLVHAPHSAHDVLRYEAYQQAKQTGAHERLRDVIQPLTNNRSLLECLEGVGHATAISTHEGKAVLRSHLFRHQLDVANVLWDGDDKITLPRPTGDRLMAFNASLNLLVMVQPEIFDDYLRKYGDEAHRIGFLPRCLFTVAGGDSLDLERGTSDSRCIDAYHEDVTRYLEQQRDRLRNRISERDPMEFSPAARALWFQLQRELRQGAGLRYWSIQAAVARALQHVTRLAGVIHCYDPNRRKAGHVAGQPLVECSGEDGISLRALKAAWAIVQWHLEQFMRLFPAKPFLAVPPLEPTAQAKRDKKIAEDAETIMAHFTKYCGKAGRVDAPQNEIIARSGLYPARFKTALYSLTDQDHLVCEGSGKKARLRMGGRHFVPQGFFGSPFAGNSTV